MRHRLSPCLASLSGAILFAASPAPALAATPTYAVTGQIAGPDGGWDYASFDPVHRRLYISRRDGVTAIDVDSGTVTPHLTDGQKTHEPLVLPGGDRLAITNGASSMVRIVGAADGKTIAEISAPKPDGAVFDIASGLIVTSSDTGVSALIDPAAKASAGEIKIGGGLEFPASDGQGRVFDNIESASQIAVLDVKAKTVTARYSLGDCTEPSGLAYDPGADVLISACSNGVAKVVAAKTGAVLASLSIGQKPDAVIYDPTRRLAFIPCGGDGVLDVIDIGKGADAAVVQVVKTERGARTGAVDPRTGALYLPTAQFGPAPSGGGHAPALPGTFHILVVSPQG